MEPQTTLPQAPGFYWWRPTAADLWRMVQLIRYTRQPDDPLVAYDHDSDAFAGLTLTNWAQLHPIGHWLPIPRPPDTEGAQPAALDQIPHSLVSQPNNS